MENLYEELKKRKRYFSQLITDKPLGLYYACFIDDFLPKIIKEHISSIKLVDANTINSIDDIATNYNFFMQTNYYSDAMYYVGSLNIPSKYYGEIVKKISDFLINYKLGKINDMKICFSCKLIDLIDAYEQEYLKNPYVEDNPNKLILFTPILNSVVNSINSDYADYIYTEVFERIFLDGYLKRTISNVIENISINEYQNLKSENISVIENIIISKKALENNEINLSDEEYKIFKDIIKDFIKFYEIGTYISDGSMSRIHLTANIEKLLNAYYEEKQRIEYMTNTLKTK